MFRLRHEFQLSKICNYGNYGYIPHFNSVYEAAMFSSIFEVKQKTLQRVLVLNLVEISKDFPI